MAIDRDQANHVFAARFFRWSLEWIQVDVANGFERLSRVRNSVAVSTLRFFESLPPGDRLVLASGLVKRFHPVAVQVLANPLTGPERELLSAKDTAIREAASTRSFERPALDQARLGREAADRAFGGLLGKELETLPAGFRFQLSARNWHLISQFSIGSEPVYVQRIRSADGVSLAETISVLSWCGVFSQTVWDMSYAGDESAVADEMVSAAALFAERWYELIDDL